jgi:hypothetical protein
VNRTRTARPSTQHVSRKTILSSTRQANHHRVHHVGNSAGDPPNRVFERHRLLARPATPPPVGCRRQCKPRPAEPGNKTADGLRRSASTRIRLGSVGANSSA